MPSTPTLQFSIDLNMNSSENMLTTPHRLHRYHIPDDARGQSRDARRSDGRTRESIATNRPRTCGRVSPENLGRLYRLLRRFSFCGFSGLQKPERSGSCSRASPPAQRLPEFALGVGQQSSSRAALTNFSGGSGRKRFKGCSGYVRPSGCNGFERRNGRIESSDCFQQNDCEEAPENRYTRNVWPKQYARYD